MLLVIDVGNTNTVLGVYENEVLIRDWRIRTVENATEDEFNVLAKALLANDKIEVSKISNTIISCVVPPMIPILDSFCTRYLGHRPSWVDAKSYQRMPILISNPDELGADRIANSVAAYAKYMKSLIVVDFGTATTFDSVSEKGEYIGGAISPGIMIAAEALFTKASKLPRVDIFRPPLCALGRDTVTSMQSGILFGYAGLVDGVVKRLIAEMGTQPTVISTGGLAPLMLKITKTIEIIEHSLTLEGLRIISNNR